MHPPRFTMGRHLLVVAACGVGLASAQGNHLGLMGISMMTDALARAQNPPPVARKPAPAAVRTPSPEPPAPAKKPRPKPVAPAGKPTVVPF